MPLWLDTSLISRTPAGIVRADQLEGDETEELDDEIDDDSEEDEDEEEYDYEDEEAEDADQGEEEEEEEEDSDDATGVWPSGVLGFRRPVALIASPYVAILDWIWVAPLHEAGFAASRGGRPTSMSVFIRSKS